MRDLGPARPGRRLGIVVRAGLVLGLACVAAGGAEGWPQWRGPLATGAAPDAAPPTAWAEGSNVLWKTPIPGTGHSSPIVWKDRVFVTTAVETENATPADAVKDAEAAVPEFHRAKARLPVKQLRFEVIALKRADGAVLWRRTVCEEAPAAATHADGSWASGSPVTDGERVYAYFGSHGLYALDMDGKPVWQKRLGVFKMKADFGEGTSPVLCGDALVLCQDQEGPSFLAAFDRKTGAERWRVPREEATSWATPLVVERGGARQIITSATGRIRAYEPGAGGVLWEVGGMTGNVIPCPVADPERVFCMSGFRGSALLAIRLDKAAGDLAKTPEAVAWSKGKDTPYVPSPLLCGGLLYYLKGNAAELTCVDAATGEPHYAAQKVEGMGTVYASPVGAGGRVYLTDRQGLTVVLAQGKAFEILARNKLDDSFAASAAVAGGELYLRGRQSLYCLGSK